MKDLALYDEQRYLIFIISVLETYIHEYGLNEPIGSVMDDMQNALIQINREVREQ